LRSQVFAVAPAVTLGLGSLPPERLKYASGLFNMMRNLGGAVGIAPSIRGPSRSSIALDPQQSLVRRELGTPLVG
jgi:hypothetical protein